MTAPAPEDELERLLRFVYLSPVGMVHLRRDGTILLANPVACGLLMPLTQAGRLDNLFTLLEPVAPGLGVMVQQFLPESGAVVEQLQVKLRSSKAAPSVIAITVLAIDRETCAAVLSDVTVVLEQQRKLFIHEQRFKAIVESVVGYGIFTVDRSGCVDEWNGSLARFTELAKERVLGQPLASLFDATKADCSAQVEEALRGGGAKFEGWVRTQGERKWVEALVSPLAQPGGETDGFSIVLHDATARKAYEEHLVRLATTDPLTGALNRREFFEVGERELRRSARYRRPLSVLLLDVDHFKSVNDTHGHDIGDRVLVKLVEACRLAVRETDLVARIGGEEFAILAPETILADAGRLAERLRVCLEGLCVETPSGPLRFTASIGCATLHQFAEDQFAEILKRADAAMYAAKRSGRNRVVLQAPETIAESGALPAEVR